MATDDVLASTAELERREAHLTLVEARDVLDDLPEGGLTPNEYDEYMDIWETLDDLIDATDQ